MPQPSASASGGGLLAITLKQDDGYAEAGIYLVRGDGRGGRLLRGAGGNVRWSPDGRRLAFREARGTFGPYLLRVTDRAARRTHTLALVRCCNIGLGNPTWSPGSDRVAYTRGIVESVAGRKVRTNRLFVARADGRGERGIALHEPGAPA